MDASPPEILSLAGRPAKVTWRRSARARRVSLRIDPRGGTVVVTLPLRAGRGAGMALLTAHADWVAQRLAALPVRLEFADGVLVPVDGRPRLIRHVADARGGAWLDGDEILVAGTVEFLPRRVADFFRLEARRRFSALAAEKAAQAGAKPRRVTVKDTRSRWGSCTADRTLSFSWRLLMAPGFVQDYVAAHEVAHLRHMNHGPHFWALVEELTPHTRTAMTWLHAEGAGLLCVG